MPAPHDHPRLQQADFHRHGLEVGEQAPELPSGVDVSLLVSDSVDLVD